MFMFLREPILPETFRTVRWKFDRGSQSLVPQTVMESPFMLSVRASNGRVLCFTFRLSKLEMQTLQLG